RRIPWRGVGAALMVALCTGGILTWQASWRPPSDPNMPLLHRMTQEALGDADPPRVAVGALPPSWAHPFEMQPEEPVSAPAPAPARRARKTPEIQAPQTAPEEPPEEEEKKITEEPTVPPPRPPETR